MEALLEYQAKRVVVSTPKKKSVVVEEEEDYAKTSIDFAVAAFDISYLGWVNDVRWVCRHFIINNTIMSSYIFLFVCHNHII